VNFGRIWTNGVWIVPRITDSRTEAQDIITNYQSNFGCEPIDGEQHSVYENGYVKAIKDTSDGYAISILRIKQCAARQNVWPLILIQGSAADMIKLAMINIYKEFQQKKFKTKMTLQVHDELVFDVYEPELNQVKELVIDKMTHAIELIVPIEVGAGVGKNWLDAH
jgi:DNA polymerase-1